LRTSARMYSASEPSERNSSASASPAANAGPLGGLTTPLSGLFKQLNANTAATAGGEYSVLQDLERALAAHIQQFLRWVTGGR